MRARDTCLYSWAADQGLDYCIAIECFLPLPGPILIGMVTSTNTAI